MILKYFRLANLSILLHEDNQFCRLWFTNYQSSVTQKIPTKPFLVTRRECVTNYLLLFLCSQKKKLPFLEHTRVLATHAKLKVVFCNKCRSSSFLVALYRII